MSIARIVNVNSPADFDDARDSIDMLKDEQRWCDICDGMISKGRHYFAVLVPRDHVPPNANISSCGFSVDALGNVRVDVCHHCKTGMGLSAGERVD